MTGTLSQSGSLQVVPGLPTLTTENLPAARTAALRPARAGLANREYARADLVFWGTSMTEGGPGVANGTGPSNGYRRWLDKLQVNLRNRLPLTFPATGSTGYIPAFYQTFYAGGTQANGVVTPNGVTYSGNLTVYGSGLGSRALGLVSTADWIQFTITGDSYDLSLSTHTTASTIAAITTDGASENFTLSSSTLTPVMFRKTGLSAGSHTVKVAFATGSPGPVVVDGIKPYNGDSAKGIHVWDAGKGSATIASVSTSSGFRGFKEMGIIQPSLVGVEWGFNEYFGNTTVATFKSNLAAFVSACQANLTTTPPTYLFIIWPEPKHPNTPIAPWSDYVQAIRSVAASTTNGVVVDFSERVAKGVSDTAGFFYGDFVHWTDKGSQHVADVLTEIIAPR